jgi:voltage-gated potassium channel
MSQFLSIVDFLAIIPWILFPIGPNLALLLELVVILKIIRYSPALMTLGQVLYYERKPVFAALFTMFIVLIFSSGVMWVLEKDLQPDSFSSIPASMWWSISTLTTVGYGDIVPITPIGKMFGGVITIMGIAMFTLPAGLLAAGFAREIKRKDFMLNFSMVSKVPFFKGLEPDRLASITSVLKQKIIPPRFVIIQKGEISNALYFIAKGEIEMDLSHGVVSLGEGEFFGEVSSLGGGGIRTASVTSVTESTLLVLKNDDLTKLMDGWPEIKDKLRQAMANKSYNQKKLYESWLENIS